jgi:hypothetical protein
MPKLQIVSPKNCYEKSNKGALIVTGCSDETIVGVFGECRLIPGPAPVIEGTTVVYAVDLKKPGQHRNYRWVIAFLVPDVGEYRLTVTGMDACGEKVSDDREFKVPPHASAAIKRMPPFEVTIPGLHQGDDITDQRCDFTPSGDLIGHDLLSVTLIEQTTNESVAHYEFGDQYVFQMWMAQFECIPDGCYKLTVTDNGNEVASVGDLRVNVATCPEARSRHRKRDGAVPSEA